MMMMMMMMMMMKKKLDVREHMHNPMEQGGEKRVSYPVFSHSASAITAETDCYARI